MSNEQTPDEWVTSRCDWLVDVGILQNGCGTFDVIIRVDGSYADLETAKHYAERHREQIKGMVRRLYRDRGWRIARPVDPPWPFSDEPEPVAAVHSGPDFPPFDPYGVVELLADYRHNLPTDILRSLAGIWFCASAARFGRPHEPFWEDHDAAAYAEHNDAECEDESHPERGPGFLIEKFCEHTDRAGYYGNDFDAVGDAAEFLAWIAEDSNRAAAWDAIRKRYKRDDQELILGALRQNPGLGRRDPDVA